MKIFFETAPLYPAARVVDMIHARELGQPGCYAWFFGADALRQLAGTIQELPPLHLERCCSRGDLVLLYIGTSSAKGLAAGCEKPRSLRSRLKNHLLGTAARSTLRRSLGLLLGQHLRPYKTKFRLDDEDALSRWMQANAHVCFAETDDPDVLESSVLAKTAFFFPLNLRDNAVLASGNHTPEKKWLLALLQLRRISQK